MTIGNIISKLESVNRLLAEARVEENEILQKVWRDARKELHEDLAKLGIIVEYPTPEEETAA